MNRPFELEDLHQLSILECGVVSIQNKHNSKGGGGECKWQKSIFRRRKITSKYKELAEKYGVSVNTMKSWIQRHRAGKEKRVHPFKLIHINY